MNNAQIAAAFEELADLYELDGAVQYRVLAYRTAAQGRARVVRLGHADRPRRQGHRDPGHRQDAREKLVALDETGDIPQAAEAAREVPAGLIAMMHLPGFGPKRARRLYDELGVDSLEALRAAGERQEVRKLRGFGAKVEEKLLESLAAGRDGDACAARSCSRARCPWPSRSSTRCAPRPAPTASRSPARCGARPTRSRTST